MLLKAYAILDLKTSVFGKPVFFSSEGECLRTLSDTFSSGDSLPAKHPEDFVLYRVGDFCDSKGVLEGAEPSVVVGPLSEYVRRAE